MLIYYFRCHTFGGGGATVNPVYGRHRFIVPATRRRFIVTP